MCRICAHKNIENVLYDAQWKVGSGGSRVREKWTPAADFTKISENPHLIINILLSRERMRARAPTPRWFVRIGFLPMPTQCKPITIKDKQESNSKYLMSHLFVSPPSFQCLKRRIHEVTDNFWIPDRKCKQTNSQSICGHLIQSVIKSCRLPGSLMKTSPIDPK